MNQSLYNLLKHTNNVIEKSYSDKSNAIQCVLEYSKSDKRVSKDKFLKLFNKKDISKFKHLNNVEIENIYFKSFDSIEGSTFRPEDTSYMSGILKCYVKIPSANAILDINFQFSDSYIISANIIVSGKTISVFNSNKFNASLECNKLFGGIKERHFRKIIFKIINNIEYVYKRFWKLKEKKAKQYSLKKFNETFSDVKNKINESLKQFK